MPGGLHVFFQNLLHWNRNSAAFPREAAASLFMEHVSHGNVCWPSRDASVQNVWSNKQRYNDYGNRTRVGSTGSSTIVRWLTRVSESRGSLLILCKRFRSFRRQGYAAECERLLICIVSRNEARPGSERNSLLSIVSARCDKSVVSQSLK